MLDTQNLERGWSPLSTPELDLSPTGNDASFSIYALAAVFVAGSSCPGGIIVLSVSDVGTYVFDVDKQVWNYVTAELLPFQGIAMSLPNHPSLCFAYSSLSQEFCAFRFCYESNTGFQVKEIRIDHKSDSDSLSPLLPPEIYYCPRITISGTNGLVYFVDSGVDNPHAIHNVTGNRYVEISALQLTNLNPGFNDQGQSLKKRCGKKKRRIAHNEDKDEMTKPDMNKGQALKSCTNKKRQMGHDEEHDETVEVALNKAESSKRGKKKKKRQMEHVKEEETKELILTRIWRSCFFGGPVCNPFMHVAAAFAM